MGGACVAQDQQPQTDSNSKPKLNQGEIEKYIQDVESVLKFDQVKFKVIKEALKDQTDLQDGIVQAPLTKYYNIEDLGDTSGIIYHYYHDPRFHNSDGYKKKLFLTFVWLSSRKETEPKNADSLIKMYGLDVNSADFKKDKVVEIFRNIFWFSVEIPLSYFRRRDVHYLNPDAQNAKKYLEDIQAKLPDFAKKQFAAFEDTIPSIVFRYYVKSYFISPKKVRSYLFKGIVEKTSQIEKAEDLNKFLKNQQTPQGRILNKGDKFDNQTWGSITIDITTTEVLGLSKNTKKGDKKTFSFDISLLKKLYKGEDIEVVWEGEEEKKKLKMKDNDTIIGPNDFKFKRNIKKTT